MSNIVKDAHTADSKLWHLSNVSCFRCATCFSSCIEEDFPRRITVKSATILQCKFIVVSSVIVALSNRIDMRSLSFHHLTFTSQPTEFAVSHWFLLFSCYHPTPFSLFAACQPSSSPSFSSSSLLAPAIPPSLPFPSSFSLALSSFSSSSPKQMGRSGSNWYAIRKLLPCNRQPTVPLPECLSKCSCVYVRVCLCVGEQTWGNTSLTSG